MGSPAVLRFARFLFFSTLLLALVIPAFAGSAAVQDNTKKTEDLPDHPTASLALTAFTTAATILDIEVTQSCLHAHTCLERDPLYGRTPSRMKMYAINVPFNAGAAYFSHKLRQKHSRFWWVPEGLVMGMHVTGLALTAKYLGHL